jgi:hypothetical protein
MKTVLYLHGLESSQGGKKVEFLSSKDYVYAPVMEYGDPDFGKKMVKLIHALKPDLIVGSSMGGYIANLLSDKFGIDCLLFNPALHSRSFEPNVKAIEMYESDVIPKKIVVLGNRDSIIDPKITKQIIENKPLTIIEELDFSHRTPLGIFVNIYNKYLKYYE